MVSVESMRGLKYQCKRYHVGVCQAFKVPAITAHSTKQSQRMQCNLGQLTLAMQGKLPESEEQCIFLA